MQVGACFAFTVQCGKWPCPREMRSGAFAVCEFGSSGELVQAGLILKEVQIRSRRTSDSAPVASRRLMGRELSKRERS